MSRLTSRFDQTPAGRVHVRVGPPPKVAGTPTVVLVHGLVISSLYMIPTADRLAGHFPVLAPDLPGFGRSEKPPRTLRVPELADALREWLDVVALQRPVLVGNSLGCQIIADFAARWPERLRAAVLAGPTMDRHARTAPRQIGRWLLDWTRERPSMALQHARDYARAGLGRAWKTFRHALEDPIEEKLPRVTVPVLVVRGSRDPIVSQRWAEEVTALLPNARLQVIPGGPHVVNYTSAGPFAALVRTFISELEQTYRADRRGRS